MPLASQLFDFDIKLSGRNDYRSIDVVKAAKAVWDIVHPDGQAEQFIADAVRFPAQTRKKIVWYIVRRLTAPFIWEEFRAQRWRRHELMIDEYRKLDVPGMIQARDFLQKVVTSRLTGIVTTNYDLIIEYALGSSGFNYGVQGEILRGRGPYPVSQWHRPVTLSGNIKLAKLHGSVSWDTSGKYSDGRGGITGNALIVAPIPEKRPPEELLAYWTLAETILQNTQCLLVFGFAFNPYDGAVLELLRISGRGLRKVCVVDVSRNAANAATSLWPNATVSWCEPPPVGNSDLQEWLSSTILVSS